MLFGWWSPYFVQPPVSLEAHERTVPERVAADGANEKEGQRDRNEDDGNRPHDPGYRKAQHQKNVASGGLGKPREAPKPVAGIEPA